jgi:hypothetical protein
MAMSCCGSRRMQLSESVGQARRAAPEPPPERLPATGAELRYTGAADLALRGPASGRVYRVGPARRQLLVETADAAALLRTGLFQAR